MNKIINENFNIGDELVGMVDNSKFLVVRVGKDSKYYGTESHNLYQNKNIYVIFKNINTGKISQTILENAQRLLLKRECF